MTETFEPVRISTNRPANTEKIHIFSIDDHHYYMPKHVPGALALQSLEKMRTEGQAGATAWILRETLGSDTYEALLKCKTAELSEIKTVIGIVTRHVLGQIEDAAGK